MFVGNPNLLEQPSYALVQDGVALGAAAHLPWGCPAVGLRCAAALGAVFDLRPLWARDGLRRSWLPMLEASRAVRAAMGLGAGL